MIILYITTKYVCSIVMSISKTTCPEFYKFIYNMNLLTDEKQKEINVSIYSDLEKEKYIFLL